MPAAPVIRIKYQGRRVRLIGFGPRKYQLFALAQAGVRSIKARVAQGIGSSDVSMPPLKGKQRSRYSEKQKRWIPFGPPEYGWPREKKKAGLNPIRDLTGKGDDGGHMLDALRVTSASDTRATIDISTRKGRLKARANEQRTPWFGFSGKDTRNMLEAARKIWGQNIAEFRANFAGVGARANAEVPIWMDPLSISSRIGQRSSNPSVAGRIADKLSRHYGRSYGTRRAA